MQTKPCNHLVTVRSRVQGIEGVYVVVYCTDCQRMLSRTPISTTDETKRRQELAAQDGRDAGPAIPCTCGTMQVLIGKHQFCGVCFSRSMIRVLAEVPVERLTKWGL